MSNSRKVGIHRYLLLNSSSFFLLHNILSRYISKYLLISNTACAPCQLSRFLLRYSLTSGNSNTSDSNESQLTSTGIIAENNAVVSAVNGEWLADWLTGTLGECKLPMLLAKDIRYYQHARSTTLSVRQAWKYHPLLLESTLICSWERDRIVTKQGTQL